MRINPCFLKLNFKGNPNESRARINEWVSDKTQKKISELFPDGSISMDTRLVVANALYFKGVLVFVNVAHLVHNNLSRQMCDLSIVY